MERRDLEYLKVYAQRLTTHDGDLSVLRPEERDHLKTLIRKHEIEQKLLSFDEQMSQAKLL